jgi:hypothetical protein
VSTRKSLWSDSKESSVESSAGIDVSLLGASIPFGLLPASDPRMRATADAILKFNVADGAPNVLTRWGMDPDQPDTRSSPSESHQRDPSSLATLWMARYLIQLGRETGDGTAWTKALTFLDEILVRMCPLGLALLPSGRRVENGGYRPNPVPGAWGLHAMLMETLLDLAGLDYDRLSRTLVLDPALPPPWPYIGISQLFNCGEVAYRFERAPSVLRCRLTVESRLLHDVVLRIGVTCPGLGTLGAWHARPNAPPPQLDPESGRLTWSVVLPEGESTAEWVWGG